MSKRKLYILLSSVSLILGFLIYVFFRENSYIGILFGYFHIIRTAREMLGWVSFGFLIFYFPDFLWGFSLCCGLLAIYTPKQTGCIVCSSITVLCGIIWEWMQFKQLVSGTGDFCDVLMYLMASIACIIINIRSEVNEKN